MPHAVTPFTAHSTRAVLSDACLAVGFDPDGAELIRLGENALYRLSTAPVVVRIARTINYLSTVTKEVHIADWLASQQFPAARLYSIQDQPRIVANHPVTFWEYIDGSVAMPDDIALLGGALRKLHRLPVPTGFPLPKVDVFARVEPRIANARIPDQDKALLIDRCEELREELSTLQYPLPECAIHGDAHIKNLMLVQGKPVLIDFEGFAWGQPEWDLATTATEYLTGGWWTTDQYAAFIEAYGFDIRNWEGFQVLRRTHEIKMTTWIMQNVDHSSDVRAEFEARMDTIRSGQVNVNWKPF